MTPRPITVSTYNMHKGMSALNRKVQLDDMAAAFNHIRPDILFLQEVQGLNLTRSRRRDNFPARAHHDILGRRLAYYSSYGQNATFKEKHHGNAILSRLPIDTRRNLDITVNRLEKRGVLHCEIRPEGWTRSVVCLCAHLNLLETDRAKQYTALFEYITTYIDAASPLILAGDFNDWRAKSYRHIGRTLGLEEVFLSHFGTHPKTFPARLPVLSLDRIYTRNLQILDAQIHNHAPWTHLSDHLPLSATLLPGRTT
ncbi:endonuclease/exonuclease/phosphatase family protein [Neisseria leonii]|uniref:endonuclease/exonuclease/phosphatase family protein n=1 Tax=Neisseria leonii TaxID=2995413 RepID=UPI00237AFB7C|nr:endonuclease/exonuclease/phosphatase family protein [Neisseria sp. 3986]MDD9325599.1 endonuclease/exonuclease/phosphatase family protein [Neisseria sp. 3986]